MGEVMQFFKTFGLILIAFIVSAILSFIGSIGLVLLFIYHLITYPFSGKKKETTYFNFPKDNVSKWKESLSDVDKIFLESELFSRMAVCGSDSFYRETNNCVRLHGGGLAVPVLPHYEKISDKQLIITFDSSYKYPNMNEVLHKSDKFIEKLKKLPQFSHARPVYPKRGERPNIIIYDFEKGIE